MTGRDRSSDRESERITLSKSKRSTSVDSRAQKNIIRKIRKLKEYTTNHYEELPKSPGVIRLLNLMPSTADDSEVHCELITPKTRQEMPPYEALSWCWGTADQKHYINIRSKGKNYAKYIRKNLFEALKALRLPDKDRAVRGPLMILKNNSRITQE